MNQSLNYSSESDADHLEKIRSLLDRPELPSGHQRLSDQTSPHFIRPATQADLNRKTLVRLNSAAVRQAVGDAVNRQVVGVMGAPCPADWWQPKTNPPGEIDVKANVGDSARGRPRMELSTWRQTSRLWSEPAYGSNFVNFNGLPSLRYYFGSPEQVGQSVEFLNYLNWLKAGAGEWEPIEEGGDLFEIVREMSPKEKGRTRSNDGAVGLGDDQYCSVLNETDGCESYYLRGSLQQTPVAIPVPIAYLQKGDLAVLNTTQSDLVPESITMGKNPENGLMDVAHFMSNRVKAALQG